MVKRDRSKVSGLEVSGLRVLDLFNESNKRGVSLLALSVCLASTVLPGVMAGLVLFGPMAEGQLVCNQPEQVVQVPGSTDVLEGYYEFVNTGSFPVSLQSARFVKKAGGGRIILPGVRTVRPGQSALLSYVIRLDRKHGEFERTIQVKTDAAKDNKQELKLKFITPELVEVDKNILAWSPGEDFKQAKVLTVKVASDRPVRVTGAESTRGFFEVKVKPVKEGDEYQVIVTPKTPEVIKAEYEAKWKKQEAARVKAGKKLPEGAMSPSHPSIALPPRLKEDRADRVVIRTDLPGKRAPRLSVLLVAREVEMTPRILGPDGLQDQVDGHPREAAPEAEGLEVKAQGQTPPGLTPEKK